MKLHCVSIKHKIVTYQVYLRMLWDTDLPNENSVREKTGPPSRNFFNPTPPKPWNFTTPRSGPLRVVVNIFNATSAGIKTSYPTSA